MQLKFFRLCLACSLLMLCCGGTLAAGTLYSQSWDGSANLKASQNDTTTGGYGNFATVYDNFHLASAGTISQLDWVGGYWNPSAQGPIDGFVLSIYADNAGQPGILLWDMGTGTFSETYLSSPGGFPCYSYSVTGAGFAAAAGTQYWLSIVPALGFPPQWGWGEGTGGDGIAYQDYFGSRSQLSADMAFTLSGTSSGVPEPFTFPMIGIGLAAMAAWRRRR